MSNSVGILFSSDSSGSSSSSSQAVLTTFENTFVTGYNFEDGTVGGWSGTGCASLTNGYPTSVGTGGTGFSSSNGGRALGTNTTAPAVTGVNPINGSFSLNLATSGAGTIGDGYISGTQALSPKYRAKNLTVKFSYNVISGTPNLSGTSSNTYAVAAYDPANNVWFGVVGTFNIVQGTGAGTFIGNFQTASNSTSYQIFVYSPVAPTGVSSLLIDDLWVGPQPLAQGPFMTDWVAYTPVLSASWGTVSGVSFWSRRVGDTLEISGQFTPGTTTAALATMTVGFNGVSGNVNIDTTKVKADIIIGYGNIAAATANQLNILTPTTSTNTINFGIQNASGGGAAALNANSVCSTGQTVAFFMQAPIVGWSSNTILSSDSYQQLVATTVTAPSGTISNSFNDITWGTIVDDSTGSFSGTTYKVPVTGSYKVYGQVSIGVTVAAGNSTQVQILQNGSVVRICNSVAGGIMGAAIVPVNFGEIKCVAGDLLKLQFMTAGSSGSYAANNQNFITFERIQNPAVLTQIDAVKFRATDTAGGSIGTAFAIYKMATVSYDSIGAYSTSTGLYTCPVAGLYKAALTAFTASMTQSTTGAFEAQLFLNGSFYSYLDWQPGNGAAGVIYAVRGYDEVQCKTGDTLSIQLLSSTATTMNTSGGANHLTITRLGN